MTVPVEEVRAIERTQRWLYELANPRGPWKRWGSTRDYALCLLRHYPWPGRAREVYEKAGLVEKE